MTTLDATLASLIEQAVDRAFERARAASLPTASRTPDSESAAQADKKPRASKKGGPADALETAVVTTTPLPAPAEPPAQAKPADVEADRARLMTLTGMIPDGRKVATELIRKHGPKFDGLPAEVRVTVIAELEQLALNPEVA